MKIFSPHRRRMENKRKFGGKEFQNKVKKAQGYKRVLDPRAKSAISGLLRFFHIESTWAQAGIILVVGVLAYYLFISPQFILADVTVTGTEKVSAQQVQDVLKSAGNERWLFIPKTHLLLLSKNYAQELITTELPLVKDITKYKRVWPNKVEIEIEERRPGFAFNIGGQDYLVDESGFIVKELDDVSGLPHVTDQVSESADIGEQLTNNKLVGFILSATHQWPNKINSALGDIKVPGKAAGFAQFMSAEGWGVFLDFNRPVEAQLSNLNLILTKQIPAKNRLQLAYIDLRFDKWAYYCYKNSPCEAQPQLNADGELVNPDGTPVNSEEGEKVEVPAGTPTVTSTPKPTPTPTPTATKKP